MSVSEAAAARGVSKQAISKRLQALGPRVTTRRDGRQLLFNTVEFDRITGAETDPAQQLRNRGNGDDRQGGLGLAAQNEAVPQQDYSRERAKREAYEAEKARLDLEERLGKLVPVVAVEAAMVRCAEAMIRIIDQLPSKSDVPDVRTFLKETGADLRKALAENMRLVANDDSASEGEDYSE
jgi:hypothetical protein